MDGGGGVPGQKSDRDFFGGMVKGNWDSVGDGATVGGGVWHPAATGAEISSNGRLASEGEEKEGRRSP